MGKALTRAELPKIKGPRFGSSESNMTVLSSIQATAFVDKVTLVIDT